MAAIIRCDKCKKLSDDSKEYIGRDWEVRRYKEVFMTIRTTKDYCQECVLNLVSEHRAMKSDGEERDY